MATIQRPMAQTPPAQQAASSVRFHHVHLNSVNPEAAAAYYPKRLAADYSDYAYGVLETLGIVLCVQQEL